MKKLIHWLFPFMLALGWIITSGYALSRLASLHAALSRQSRLALQEEQQGGVGSRQADRSSAGAVA